MSFAIVFTALAAEPPRSRPAGITLQEARARASTAAPDVVLARARTAVIQTTVGIAATLANPTLNLGTATQTARLATGVSVPLPLFGQRGLAIDAAQSDLRAAQAEETVARQDARWQAAVAWLDLWEAGQRAALLSAAADDAARLAEVAAERADAGTGATLDQLRAAAEARRARAASIGAVRSQGAAAHRLAGLIGASDEALAPDGRPELLESLPDVARLTQSLPRHPALARDELQMVAAESRLALERRQRWPVVNASLALNQLDPTLPGPDLVAGLSFEVPVLNRRGAPIAQAEAQVALSEAVRGLEERRLRAALGDAMERATAAQLELASLRDEVLPVMETVAQRTHEAYALGSADLVRVLEANRALHESRLAVASARAAWARALADLELAAGVDLETWGASRAP